MGKDYSSVMDNPLGQSLRELPGPLLLTGHTGFKGTWMTFLLEHLNVPLVGYSLPADKDSLYDRADRIGAIPEVLADIRDYETLEKFVDAHKPSTIIHMAAQPLVLRSYESPRETFDVNVMGTVNILDIAFKKNFVKAIIIVTTDKVYRNNNSSRAFVESDPLEGKDPYSASKVGAESVVSAWQQIAKVSGGPKLVSVRAGNVIGGGDFAKNRIIPDLIHGVMKRKPVEIRNPESVRPWIHVLDPLVGYLVLLGHMIDGEKTQNFNFGPNGNSFKVRDIVKVAEDLFKGKLNVVYSENATNLESEFLTLNVDKAKKDLNWSPVWSTQSAIERTVQWWIEFIENGNPSELVKNDINSYFKS
jgi:CDP-glucose 4,6-dehydratase